MMPITDTQAQALAQFAATLRPGTPTAPRWDPPGIRAAIHAAKRRAPAGELAIALIRLAGRDDLRTPALLAEDGPHWVALPFAETHAPQRRKCPTHGIAVRVTDGLCTGCVADRKAADDNRDDTLAIDPDRAETNARGARTVLRAIEAAQKGARP
jgi:hypothetical protein